MPRRLATKAHEVCSDSAQVGNELFKVGILVTTAQANSQQVDENGRVSRGGSRKGLVHGRTEERTQVSFSRRQRSEVEARRRPHTEVLFCSGSIPRTDDEDDPSPRLVHQVREASNRGQALRLSLLDKPASLTIPDHKLLDH